MATENQDPKPSIAGVEDLITPMPMIDLPQEQKEELERWIAETLPRLIAHRKEKVTRIQKYRKTLGGERALPPLRRGASNLSVPLTVWAAAATRARLDESLWRVKPIVTIEPLQQADAAQAQLDAKALARFYEEDFLSSEGLNGREVGRQNIVEGVNFGTTALKVIDEPDDVLFAGPGADDPAPHKVVVKGRPKLVYISFEDLIYWDGYGTNTQKMPYVGHQTEKTWSEIQKWVALGYYKKEWVDEVEAFYKDATPGSSAQPAVTRIHNVAELYLDWVVPESEGLPAALMIDFHEDAGKVMRVTWNPMPRGVRPLFVAQFDSNPDPKCLDGLGVSQKLEGAQDETDEIHNIGIEAGKRAAAHLVGIKFGSMAEGDLGGDDPVLPGDVYVTSDPDKDVTTKPLGDPRAAESAIMLEEHTRIYVMRLLGFDEARLGQVDAGKRVPASLGMTTIREGKVTLSHAAASFGEMYQQASYLVFELYKRRLPLSAMRAVLSEQQVERLLGAVFSTPAPFRESFVLRINAQDAASIEETRKQELMILTQFLMGFYDKVLSYAQLAISLPPPLQRIVVGVLAKLENGVKTLMAHVESIPNPSEVIPEVSRMIEALNQVGAQVRGPAGNNVPSGSDEDVEGLEARGGGVV